MKRILIALVLLIAVLLTVFFGSKTVISLCDASLSELEQSLDAAQSNDWNKTTAHSDKLLKKWDENRLKALCFSNRGEIDKINERIAVLAAIADRKNLSEFEETAAEIGHMLKMLRHEQFLTAESFV